MMVKFVFRVLIYENDKAYFISCILNSGVSVLDFHVEYNLNWRSECEI